MPSLARWSFRHRRIVLLIWIAAVVGLGAFSSAVGDAFDDDFNLPDTESTRAIELIEQEFPQATGAARGDAAQVVVQARTGQLSDPAVRDQVTAAFDRLRTVEHVGEITSFYSPEAAQQISPDKRTAFASLTFDKPASELKPEEIQKVLSAVEDGEASWPGIQVELGGQVISIGEQPEQNLSELIGFVAAAVVLFIAFGSLLAMTLPLLVAVLALGAGISAITLLTHVFPVAQFAPQLATLIGLGVGIDYALFIVTRHRANLRRGMSIEDSAVSALDTAGRAVLFAGAIVCIALLGLFALGVSFLYGVAVSAAMVVAFTMVSALTLLPALLGFYGERVLSRRTRRKMAATGPSDSEELSPRWWAWGRFVERHPAVLATAAGLLMVLLALPFFSMRLGSSDQGNGQPEKTSRQAYDLLAEGFGPGFNGPFLIAAKTDGPAQQAALPQLAAALQSTPGVAFVTPPQPSPNGKAAILQLFPTTSPQDEATSDLLDRLREDVIPAATAGSGAVVYVGGITAIFDDFASVLTGKLPLFIGVVVLLAFLLLAAVFRSLLVPLTASVMNLLAAGAAFGVVVAVFQWGWFGDLVGIGSPGPVEAFLPVMMFAILFGLSMDYEVFLVSRIHEEWLHRKDNRLAVTLGQAETGQVITAAAAIMVLVFGSFVFGGERIIKEFGIGLAAAVLLDALIVRTILVPAVMHLFGKANWWLPMWMDKILPRLHVEGSMPVAHPEPPEPPEDTRERELEPTGS